MSNTITGIENRNASRRGIRNPAEEDARKRGTPGAGTNTGRAGPASAQSAEFDRAIQRAQQKRTHADGLSPAQHGHENVYRVKPGDTLDAISHRAGISLAGLESHNAQIRNPDLIHPGDVVFVPRSPTAQEAQVDHAVNDARAASRQASTLEHRAAHGGQAAAKLREAQAEATARWQKVKDVVADQFRDIGGAARAFPEDAIAPRLNELKGQAAGDRNFTNAVLGARDEAMRQWHAEGRTHAELDPLYKADADLRNGTQPGAKRQAFDNLVGTVQQRLQNAAGGGSPGEQQSRIAGEASRLKALGPNDPAFGAAVDQAVSNLKSQRDAAAQQNNSGAALPAGGQATPAPQQTPTPQQTPAQQQTPAPQQAPTQQQTPAQQANNGHSQPVAPILPNSNQFFKGGAGIEVAAKAADKATASGEPYLKGSFALGKDWNLNFKLKYTPRIKATFGPGKPVWDSLKSQARDIKAYLPEKMTLDLGFVYGKRAEAGRSWEFTFKDGLKVAGSTYLSKKDPTNVLIDNAQIKLGKFSPREIAGAIVKGTRESLALSTEDAKANGRWSPLRQEVWNATKNGEITFAGEKGLIDPQGQFSGFVNTAAKTTLDSVGKVLEPTETPPRPLANFGGFALGTAANIGGTWLTDSLIGKDISNEHLRKAVDGFGGGMAGVAVDAGVQKVLPAVTSKVAPAIGKAVEPVLTKAAPILEKAAPVLEKAAPVLAKVAPAAGVLGKVARVGGPAGALLAGIPDGIDAYKNFKAGNTAEGWKATGRAAVKVGFTAAGAALGSLIPVPGVGTVAGAVAGGFVGDMVAKLF